MTEPKQAELLPCPFCGGGAFIDEYTPTGDPTVAVFSCSCNSEGCPIAFRDHDTFDRRGDAIKAWNTRPTPPKQKAREKVLVEALEFYADKENWRVLYTEKDFQHDGKTWSDAKFSSKLNEDRGSVAAKALKTYKGEA